MRPNIPISSINKNPNLIRCPRCLQIYEFILIFQESDIHPKCKCRYTRKEYKKQIGETVIIMKIP